jgi:hypothetical protein
MSDPTTLNPTQQADQFTVFTLTPACVRCGHAGLSARRDGSVRCDGCMRAVVGVEYAPETFTKAPR